jgi:hypothetical protein
MSYGDFWLEHPWYVCCYAHTDLAVEDSYSQMIVRLAGLIPIGVSSLKIMHLENKIMLFARTPRCLMSQLGT